MWLIPVPRYRPSNALPVFLTKQRTVATGAAIFVWLTLVFFGDLGLMGSTILFKLQVAELFQISLINPLQVFKMATLGSISTSLDVLGPAGLYATRTYGEYRVQAMIRSGETPLPESAGQV